MSDIRDGGNTIAIFVGGSSGLEEVSLVDPGCCLALARPNHRWLYIYKGFSRRTRGQGRADVWLSRGIMDPQVVREAKTYLCKVQRALDDRSFSQFVDTLRGYKYRRMTRRQTLLKLHDLLRTTPVLLRELEDNWNKSN